MCHTHTHAQYNSFETVFDSTQQQKKRAKLSNCFSLSIDREKSLGLRIFVKLYIVQILIIICCAPQCWITIDFQKHTMFSFFPLFFRVELFTSDGFEQENEKHFSVKWTLEADVKESKKKIQFLIFTYKIAIKPSYSRAFCVVCVCVEKRSLEKKHLFDKPQLETVYESNKCVIHSGDRFQIIWHSCHTNAYHLNCMTYVLIKIS